MRFDNVRNQDVTCIFSIHSHMDNRPYMMALFVRNTQTIHQLRVADSYRHAFHLCNNTVSTDFLNVCDTAAVDWLAICFLKAFADGV